MHVSSDLLSYFKYDFSVFVCTKDTVLWRALSGNHASNSVARNQLTDYFLDVNATVRARSPVLVCLLDEIDYISRDENVMYNFIEWSLRNLSGLLIIGISNSSSWPESLSAR
jgi:Cdc6-like AAA superfamily ATPase